MSDLLIEQFCQMLAEHLEDDSSVSKSESIAFLQSVIQADARLRTVFEDRMVQFNQGNAVGFQTWLESGARGFFGTNYVVQDPAVLRDGMTTLLDELARRPVGIPSNLPLSGVVKFVGREEQLAQVHEKLQAASTVAVTSVSGMGGVGKTELALQYAYQHLQSQTYPGGLCWINVRSENVGLGLLAFARTQLGMPEPPDMLETLLEKVQWVCRRWQGEPILVVLDDVTDDQVVRPYLDLLDPRFRVLMTTRLKLLASAQRLELEVLTEAASLELLRVLVDNPYRIDSQLVDAQRLCEWLGYLPLGLELVGRYLARREDLSLVEMLERLESKKLAAQALVQAKQMTAQLGVAAAFQLTWEDEQFPDEAKMLCGLLSLFALAPIPWNLIEKCLPDWDKEVLEDCRVDHLLGRSLLSRVGKDLFQLHQLLREFFAVKREQMVNDVALKQTVCQVTADLAIQMPTELTLQQIEQFTPVIPHLKEVATTLCSWLNDADLMFPSTRVAQFYESQADYESALPWCQYCLETVATRLSKEHPNYALSLTNLAKLCQAQGIYNSDVELLYQRSLEIFEKQLGREHSNVALSLNGLATLHQAQGHYAEARSLYEQSIHIWQQLDSNHLDIATGLNNLAAFCQAQGHYSEAENFYKQSLTIWERWLGNDHPNVATSLGNLAELCRVQGRYSEAETLYLRAMTIRERKSSAEHPDIARHLHNLATLHHEQGRYNDAETFYKQSLVIREQKLGIDHPEVAASLNNLAYLYQAQGRYDDAKNLYRRSLEILEQLFGSDHPNVATNLSNLAELYRAQGQYVEAEPLYIRSLVVREQQLGGDHPDVAISLQGLAELYLGQGRYTEAEPLYMRSLSIQEQQLGDYHPDVATSLNNLAGFYLKQGRYNEAESLYTRSLSIREQQLGGCHPDVAISLNNLAELYKEQGRYSDARQLYMRSITILLNSLGADHPTTQTAQQNFYRSLEG